MARGGVAAVALLFILNAQAQACRWLLTVLAPRLASALHYGPSACIAASHSSHVGEVGEVGPILGPTLPIAANWTSCAAQHTAAACIAASTDCSWLRTGDGAAYELLAGPAFVVVYTMASVPLGAVAAARPRVAALALMAATWSTATLAMGFWCVNGTAEPLRQESSRCGERDMDGQRKPEERG